MRSLKPSIPLSDINRPIARSKAQFLNTLAYAFNQPSPQRDIMQVPDQTNITVSVVVEPKYPLSITDSALYRELHTYITSDSTPSDRSWDADLIFPASVGEFDEDAPEAKNFDRRVGRELIILYRAFYDLLDAANDFASPTAPRDY